MGQIELISEMCKKAFGKATLPKLTDFEIDEKRDQIRDLEARIILLRLKKGGDVSRWKALTLKNECRRIISEVDFYKDLEITFESQVELAKESL